MKYLIALTALYIMNIPAIIAAPQPKEVNVVNTPDVNIVNTSSNPVPVTITGNTSQGAYVHILLGGIFQAGSNWPVSKNRYSRSHTLSSANRKAFVYQGCRLSDRYGTWW